MLEQSANSLVAQVMKVQILDAEDAFCTRKRLADRPLIEGKNHIAIDGLSVNNFPCALEHAERLADAHCVSWVLDVIKPTNAFLTIEVAPLKAADFFLAPTRDEREFHNVLHRYDGSHITRGEVLQELLLFRRRYSPGTALALGHQAAICEFLPGVLDRGQVNVNSKRGPHRAKHLAKPHQVIQHGGRACTVVPTRYCVGDEVRCSELAR